MYSPSYAIENDFNKISKVIRNNSLATVVFQNDGNIESFPLPLVLEGKKLLGHFALANSEGMALDNKNVLVIFHGPEAYISPTWYGDNNKDVPTWNYIVINVKGTAYIRREVSFIKKAIKILGNQYDSKLDIIKNIDEHTELLNAIVGIEIEIIDIFAKFKLGQRKSVEARKNVMAYLQKSLDSKDQAMAEAIGQTLT